MVDFTKLADARIQDIEQPKPLPVGTYEALIKGVPQWKESRLKDKDTGAPLPMVQVTYQVVSAGADIDPDELEAAGGLMRGSQAKTINQDFIFNDNKPPFSLKKFLKTFNLDEGLTLTEAFQEIAGESVIIAIKHRTDKEDPEVKYQEIERAFANR